MKNSSLRKIPLLLLVIPALIAHAQKLPAIQTASLRAPDGIKIDGLATEWNGQYQVYNKNVEFFYSIANDDDNLYVVIHAAKSRIIEKIIEGGVTFTVNNTGKKDDIKSSRVLFPLMPLPIGKGTLIIAGKSLTGTTNTKYGEDLTQTLNDVARDKKANSIAKANKQLHDNLKDIKIASMIAITDTVPGVNENSEYYRTLPLRAHYLKFIGVKNHDDIMAMVQFDQNGELTYELAIPLKLMALGTTNFQKLFYNVTINGRGEDGRPGNTYQYGAGIDVPLLNKDMEEPTDFWGQYTLAKKQ